MSVLTVINTDGKISMLFSFYSSISSSSLVTILAFLAFNIDSVKVYCNNFGDNDTFII